MSCDIDIYHRRDPDNHEKVTMNWIRNSFGLERWASRTYEFETNTTLPERQNLWYVINHWAYERSARVNRALFKRVVDQYAAVIENIEQAYYWFTADELLFFVVFGERQSLLERMPKETSIFGYQRIVGMVQHAGQVGIPVEHFHHLASPYEEHATAKSKEWFAELVRGAELLQNPAYTYYCSN